MGSIDYVQIHLSDIAALLLYGNEQESAMRMRKAFLDLVNKDVDSEFDFVREALSSAEEWQAYTAEKMSRARAAKKKHAEEQQEEGKEDAPQPPRITHKFVPPTLEEVRAECARRGMQDISEAFIGFYESNGWKVGHNQMKSWKGALTTWQHREVVRKSSPPRYESESARTSRINNEFMSRKNAGESSESIAADFEKRKAAGTL